MIIYDRLCKFDVIDEDIKAEIKWKNSKMWWIKLYKCFNQRFCDLSINLVKIGTLYNDDVLFLNSKGLKFIFLFWLKLDIIEI